MNEAINQSVKTKIDKSSLLPLTIKLALNPQKIIETSFTVEHKVL